MQTWRKCLHIITQCTIILRLLPKDTCSYPNTLPICSLPKVNFYVFHPRDLTHYLICLLYGPSISHFSFLFIFALFGVFSFSFPFLQFFSFSSHNHDEYEVRSNHILISTIFQDIFLFTPIMFHNFQQSTHQFLLFFFFF